MSGVRTPLDIAELREAHARRARRAAGDPARRSSATTATCRTRSSPWRRATSSCSRRAPRSARRRPRCGSPSTRSRRSCSSRGEALMTIDAAGARDAAAPDVRAATPTTRCSSTGVAASPGAAKGEIVFSAPDAVAAAEEGRDVILVRPFTEAEDVAGFHAAQGDPHQHGRQGQPRRAGGARDGQAVRGGRRRPEGRPEGRDGCAWARPSWARATRSPSTAAPGVVTADDVPLEEPEMSDAFETVLEWADEVRTLGVRANADTAGGRHPRARVRRRGHRPAAAASTSSSAPSTSSGCRT